MKEIKLKVDWYTKFALTLIGFALLGLLFRPLFLPQKLEASNITDVNVAQIGGCRPGSMYGTPIPVKIVK